MLCDPRYGSSAETTASLSKWVRSSVKQCRNVEASLPQVASFFRSHQPQDDPHQEEAPASVTVELPAGPPLDPPLVGYRDGGSDGEAGGPASQGPDQAASELRGAVKGSPEPALVQQSLSQV